VHKRSVSGRRTLLDKIALNFTTKIQTRFEEATGKEAPSKPMIRERLDKIEEMLSAMNDCIRILKEPEVSFPVKKRAISWSFVYF
jgi:hypothetical protein